MPAVVVLVAIAAAACVGSAERPRRETDAGAAMPMSGAAEPGLASFDRVIPAFMRRWQLPGGAVAVVKEGRLVLARGYGWADREAHQPVEPDSMFRIASLSKSITAATVLELVEGGKLRLDEKAFVLLGLKPPASARVDPRIDEITVRQLLQHTGGWDQEQTFDPMFHSREIVAETGAPAPASAAVTVRYMLGKPLQFAPGTRYAYSNFGYCVLGRVIERITGQRYESYVKSHLLARAGISCMRLGRSLPEGRAPKEVHYYDSPGIGPAASVFTGGAVRVPWPYGGWSMEAHDSVGGWIASAVDMARFVNAVDGRQFHPQLLGPQSIQEMTARPSPPPWAQSDVWYGMGWFVRPAGADANWWHMGALEGTMTLMVRAGNGLTWVAFFNSRAKDYQKSEGELDDAMWRAVQGVTQWPDRDLFARFVGCPADG
jgi:CubicO group peptidase (beta-lactamase class C family)